MSEDRLDVAPADGDIALIGMACRFPGAETPDEFWRLLIDGVEAIDTISADELRQAGVDPATAADPHYVRKAPRLADIAGFDADLFGIAPRDAEILDPQHRLFLECAWEALEHAGHAPDRPGQAVGVFAGCGMPGYFITNLAANAELIRSVGAYALMLANDKDFLATRVAYKLGLTGPACTVQTACSTGLVAVHLACQSLLAGECGMALAGAASLRVPQAAGYLFQPGMILSPDGHCRPFDADAQGTVGGSGVGVVALRRLDDARRDGDPIIAVIKATTVNNDGNDKVGYTAPSVSGQEAVIADALAIAGVRASDIGYIEAHGTATPLGDPVELRALANVFASSGASPLLLGSVKSNFGHLDTAAGIAGLIKAALAIQHGRIPPSLHFKSLSPQASFAADIFRVPTSVEPWPADATPRRAGVSSFGIGGTNAHAILEQAPPTGPAATAAPPFLLVLSAGAQPALTQATIRLADHFDGHPELDMADVAHTLAVGRASLRHRRFVVCRDVPDAAHALRSPAGPITSSDASPPVAFMFPGQGSQNPGMAARLYHWAPVFRREVDHCAEILQAELPGLRELLLSADATQINRTEFAQPALFVMSFALARQWMQWGVQPTCMIGHSLGELIAAAVAEVIDLPDALRLVMLRGRLMQAAPAGAMLAVGMGESELSAQLPDTLALAAVNGPRSCVVAGPVDIVEDFAAQIARSGVTTARLTTSHAFHSRSMEEALAALLTQLRGIELSPPKIPFISNLTGSWISAEQAIDPHYWIRQARQPVRFSDGLATLLTTNGVALLELGSGRVLSGLARAHPGCSAATCIASATSRQAGGDDASACLEALGTLWAAGVAPHWPAVIPGPRRRVALPTYAFQHRRYWIDPPSASKSQILPERGHPRPMPDATRDPAGWLRAISWRRLPALHRGTPPGQVLIFSDGSPLAKAIIALSPDAVVVQATGAATRQNTIVIDPSDERCWQQLADSIVASDDAPATVLYLWSLVGDEASGFHYPVAFARALERRARRHPISILAVTCGAQDVLGGEVANPNAALVVGPTRVIRDEMPWITSRCVDIAASVAEAAPLLLAEAAAHDSEIIVAHRGAHRWGPTAEPARAAPDARPPLRERGVYLIIGGLGGIGLSLAHDLARYCNARLLLTSRSGLPPRDAWRDQAHGESVLARRLRRIISIEQDGGEVAAVAADAADPAKMREVFALAEARFGALDGVIHAAGVPGKTMIARTDHDSARHVLASKATGMRVLAPLLLERRLDFVALCSSTSGLTGGIGQAAYCAANAALDAWAHHLRMAGVPAISIDWGTWRDIGMAVETAVPDDLTAWRTGTLAGAITPQEGGAAFRLALASGLTQIVIAPADADHAEGYETVTEVAAGHALAKAQLQRAVRDDLQQDYIAPSDDVQRALAGIWEELLGVAPIGIDDDFFVLGGHSLLATRILARISNEFAIDMSIAAIFEHPTIARLADEIVLRQIATYDAAAVQTALADIKLGK